MIPVQPTCPRYLDSRNCRKKLTEYAIISFMPVNSFHFNCSSAQVHTWRMLNFVGQLAESKQKCYLKIN